MSLSYRGYSVMPMGRSGALIFYVLFFRSPNYQVLNGEKSRLFTRKGSDFTSKTKRCLGYAKIYLSCQGFLIVTKTSHIGHY